MECYLNKMKYYLKNIKKGFFIGQFLFLFLKRYKFIKIIVKAFYVL